MEKGDIAPTVHKHIACWFEGLLITKQEVQEKRRLFKREREITEDDWIRSEVRLWRPNDLPIKSVHHMVNHLNLGVEVYTYMEPELAEAAMHWLARKGISVTVYSYDDFEMLKDDFKYNRDVHTLFTPFEDDAARLGFRATVVKPDGTFGF